MRLWLLLGPQTAVGEARLFLSFFIHCTLLPCAPPPDFHHPLIWLSRYDTAWELVPAPHQVQFADLAGGAWPAALQAVAALYRRDAASAGDAAATGNEAPWADRLVRVNMAAGAHAALTLPLARRAASGEAVGAGRDLLTGPSAAYGVFRTAGGGWLAVGALEEHFWRALCAAAGLPACGIAEGLASPALRAQLEGALLGRTAEEWEAALGAAGVPATALVPPERASAHLEALTGDRVTVRVRLQLPGGGGGGNGGGGGGGTEDVLELVKTPLSLGQPADGPGPALGADGGGTPFRS